MNGAPVVPWKGPRYMRGPKLRFYGQGVPAQGSDSFIYLPSRCLSWATLQRHRFSTSQLKASPLLCSRPSVVPMSLVLPPPLQLLKLNMIVFFSFPDPPTFQSILLAQYFSKSTPFFQCPAGYTTLGSLIISCPNNCSNFLTSFWSLVLCPSNTCTLQLQKGWLYSCISKVKGS